MQRKHRSPRNHISVLPAPLRKLACRLIAEGERSPSTIESALRAKGAPRGRRIRSESIAAFMRTDEYRAFRSRHAQLERLHDFIAWFRDRPGWRMHIGKASSCTVTDADGRILLSADSLEALLSQLP